MSSKKLAHSLFNIALITQLVTASTLAGKAVADETVAAPKPHIDLAFCIDTTGSMQGEIDNVKAKTKEIVAKLAGGKPSPVIRVALVAFRDRGDEYVTKVFPFNEDIDKVVKDISSLQADGGGDGPEAVNQALHVSVNDLKWDTSGKTLKMLFLIGDAAPHHYPRDYDWKTESRNAIAKGIQINTLACEGLQSYDEAEGVGVWKEIAKLSDGKFEQLAYRQEVVDRDGHRETIISSAGRRYAVKTKGADDWRAGAEALTAKGVAVPVAASSTVMAKSMGMSRTRAFGRPMMAVPPSAPGASGGAGVAAEAYSGEGPGYYAADSRADSNLADLVLEATKSAAAKKLNLEFKTK